MGRIKLKKKIKFSKSNIVILLIVTILIGSIIFLNFINNKAMPVLFNYAEIEARKLASIVINNAVGKYVTENVLLEDLFIITKNDMDEITSMDFNPITVNKILTQATTNIQTNLKYIEQGRVDLLNVTTDSLISYDIDKLNEGIIYEIPSGIITGNVFLSNVGPKIPVRFTLIGDINSYVNTKVTNYGINNALIEINIVLELTEQLILPFATEKITIKTSIPVGLKMMQGSVPDYYMNGIDSNSPIFSVPIN